MALTNADILKELPKLSDLSNNTLKAVSGTLTTLTTNDDDIDDSFNNSYICFLSGGLSGVDRVINNISNSIITFDTLSETVLNTTQYSITKNGFISYIEKSNNILINDFRNAGKDFNLFLTVLQLKQLHLYKTIELICQNLMQDGNNDDIFFIHYSDYKKMYSNEFMRLKADYDLDKDGSIDSDELSGVNNSGQQKLVR